jgi:hypothetical protein
VSDNRWGDVEPIVREAPDAVVLAVPVSEGDHQVGWLWARQGPPVTAGALTVAGLGYVPDSIANLQSWAIRQAAQGATAEQIVQRWADHDGWFTVGVVQRGTLDGFRRATV